MKAKKKDTPNLMSTLSAPKRRGRPPKKEKTKSAEEIAASMEAQGRFWLEQAKFLRGQK